MVEVRALKPIEWPDRAGDIERGPSRIRQSANRSIEKRPARCLFSSAIQLRVAPEPQTIDLKSFISGPQSVGYGGESPKPIGYIAGAIGVCRHGGLGGYFSSRIRFDWTTNEAHRIAMRHIGLMLPAAIGYVLIPITHPIALNAAVPPCSHAQVLSNLSDVIWKNNTQMELLAKIGLMREQVAKFSFTDIRPTPLYQDSSIRTCEAAFHVDLDLDTIEKKLGAMAAAVAMMLGASLAATEKVSPTIVYTIENTDNGRIDVKWLK